MSFDSAEFIRLNRDLVATLNPDSAPRWIVAENSPDGSVSQLAVGEHGLEIIKGVGAGHIPSYHHILALEKCIELADTRFVLVIDPDMFVVRNGWIEDVIQHMLDHGLAIFGVPWHPQSGAKYRYFPAVHFSVFDTELLRKDLLDLRPDFPDRLQGPSPQATKCDSETYFVRSPLAKALARFPFFQKRRRYYTDTGSRLYKKWVDASNIRYQYLDPIWSATEALSRMSRVGKLLQFMLPEELCYVPKGYRHSSEDFLSTGPLRIEGSRWEQFSWRDQPFCFHVRLNLDRPQRDSRLERAAVEEVLDRLRLRGICRTA